MAPVIVEQMAHMIQELKEQGVSILLSEQNMHFAELVSDRAYVLERGEIRYAGSMEALAADEDAFRTGHLGSAHIARWQAASDVVLIEGSQRIVFADVLHYGAATV